MDLGVPMDLVVPGVLVVKMDLLFQVVQVNLEVPKDLVDLVAQEDLVDLVDLVAQTDQVLQEDPEIQLVSLLSIFSF